METARIIWSGLSGRTGQCALQEIKSIDGVEIVAGIKREICGADDVRFLGTGRYCKLYAYKDLGRVFCEQPAVSDFDVLVDFSHTDVFDKVLKLAVCTGKPLISGTSGLSDRQMASLYDATGRIPVFRGGNFRFKVKKFIDEAVKLAMREEGRLDLYENFYQGKSLPSEISKVLQRRIMRTTGRTVEVHSADNYGYMNLICNWEFQVHRDESPTNVFIDKVCCRTIGFDELAHDVLEIAKVMAKKPVKKGEFYDLDEIWDDFVSQVV